MNSFSLSLSEKGFILLSFFKSIFCWIKNSRLIVFFFLLGRPAFHSPLDCSGSGNCPAVLILSLCVRMFLFALAVFKTVSLALAFGSLYVMCIEGILFLFSLLGVLWALWVEVTHVSFTFPSFHISTTHSIHLSGTALPCMFGHTYSFFFLKSTC